MLILITRIAAFGFLAGLAIVAAGCSSAKQSSVPIARNQRPEPVTGWNGVKNISRVDRFTFAGQPDEASLERFAREGGAMVVDLRTHQGTDAPGFDEAARVRALGMQYTHIPMSPQTFTPGDVDAFAAAIDRTGGPVLVHCATSNRVGGLWAAYLARTCGVPVEDAIEAGKAAGLHSPEAEAATRRVIAR